MKTKSIRQGEPIANLLIGTIIEVDGTHIVAELDSDIAELSRIYGGELYTIGQFGSIVRVHFGRQLIYGYVSRLRMKSEYDRERGYQPEPGSATRILEADLFGEAEWVNERSAEQVLWRLKFERGVSTFPLPQQHLYLTPKSELVSIFGQAKTATVILGEHVGTGGAPCYADINELLGKHTAVLGSTGAGKSGTVAAILHAILEQGQNKSYKQWNPRVVLLDPHNEYWNAFKDVSIRLSTDERSLLLPYWLLNLQETLALIIGKTEFEATSQTNIVKAALLAARQKAATSLGIDSTRITVDSPVPYSLDQLIDNIKASMPPQESKRDSHNSILLKLDVLMRDSRFLFMMTPWTAGTDEIDRIVTQFLGDGEPIRIVDLSGVPNEIAGAASAAIARTLFSVKLWQTQTEREATPLLLVCEEAHRYVPNRGEAQYEAAQGAIQRLAKEGRKYGIGLMLVSQRPSEVEATVLSQCNSWIVMRVTNDADREHVRSILPDGLIGLGKALSGLRRREAIFVGQAAMLPSRILVRHLSEDHLPRSHDIDFDKGWQHPVIAPEQLKEVAERWRYQSRGL
jgi:DNA helicase HerA-like ATPase